MLPSDFPTFPFTALVVEDEPLIAMDLGDVLTDLGFIEIGYARNVAEATAAVAGRRWDIVLLDIGLDASGDVSTLAAHLRELRLPFILSTGYSDPPLGFEAVPLVRKPYTVAEIIAALIMAGLVTPPHAPTAMAPLRPTHVIYRANK